nr:hypothetical protein [uncultured Deefgea sp.]
MYEIRLKKYQFQHQSFAVIVDEFDCPVDPFVSAYLSRLPSQSFNTQLRNAVELPFVLQQFCFGGLGFRMLLRMCPSVAGCMFSKMASSNLERNSNFCLIAFKRALNIYFMYIHCDNLFGERLFC